MDILVHPYHSTAQAEAAICWQKYTLINRPSTAVAVEKCSVDDPCVRSVAMEYLWESVSVLANLEYLSIYYALYHFKSHCFNTGSPFTPVYLVTESYFSTNTDVHNCTAL